MLALLPFFIQLRLNLSLVFSDGAHTREVRVCGGVKFYPQYQFENYGFLPVKWRSNPARGSILFRARCISIKLYLLPSRKRNRYDENGIAYLLFVTAIEVISNTVIERAIAGTRFKEFICQSLGRARRNLLQQCDCHTLLRLPTGVFYAQGVKANVLFFDRKPGSIDHWTQKLWIYDLRTNKHFTLKTNPLTYTDLRDFVECYNPENRLDRNETERFKSFTYEELIQRDKANLESYG